MVRDSEEKWRGRVGKSLASQHKFETRSRWAASLYSDGRKAQDTDEPFAKASKRDSATTVTSSLRMQRLPTN